jgi:type IV pilus assembly protein PilM
MAEAEVQARIPFPADVAVTDCNVLEEKTRGRSRGLEVFFVAVHRDLIDIRFQLLRSVGLIPIAIDVDFLALARLLGFTNQIPDDEDIAIIDIGAFKTSVRFYQHGKLHLYTHVPVAGDILTDEVSQQLKISWEEAEERKKKAGCGIPTPTPPEEGKEVQNAEVGNSVISEPEEQPRLRQDVPLEDPATEVIQWALEGGQGLYPQLQSRFDFYEADFPDFKPSKIFSAGGTSQLPGLNNFLASRLLIPVENVSYLESPALRAPENRDIPEDRRLRLTVDAKGDVSEIKNNEPLFATAVGLALKKKL